MSKYGKYKAFSEAMTQNRLNAENCRLLALISKYRQKTVFLGGMQYDRDRSWYFNVSSVSSACCSGNICC